MVRVSLGFYNYHVDVGRLLDALRQIAAGRYSGTYRADCDGDYHPAPRAATLGEQQHAMAHASAAG